MTLSPLNISFVFFRKSQLLLLVFLKTGFSEERSLGESANNVMKENKKSANSIVEMMDTLDTIRSFYKKKKNGKEGKEERKKKKGEGEAKKR